MLRCTQTVPALVLQGALLYARAHFKSWAIAIYRSVKLTLPSVLAGVGLLYMILRQQQGARD